MFQQPDLKFKIELHCYAFIKFEGGTVHREGIANLIYLLQAELDVFPSDKQESIVLDDATDD